MKVSFSKDYKEILTVAEVETAKAVIKNLKEDCTTAAEYAEYAVREALKGKCDYLNRVLEAKAEISTNGRAWNVFSGDSGHIDIWLSVIAKTVWGFIELGAYLSDIFLTGAESYQDKIYIANHFMDRPENI